jgi:hypothetical protein
MRFCGRSADFFARYENYLATMEPKLAAADEQRKLRTDAMTAYRAGC